MKSIPFRPRNDCIVVKRDDKADVSEGGIHLPGNSRKTSNTGTVIAVGSGRRTKKGVVVEPSVAPGDRIVFDRYAGVDIQIEDEIYAVMAENAIFAVEEK